MKQDCCPWRSVAAILLAALVLRCAAAVWWQSRLETPTSFQFGDSQTYWGLAGQLAEGKPYQYGSYDRVFRTPGYPLMLAGVFRLVGRESVLPARLLGALLGTLSVALLMLLARELFDIRVALLSGALAAVYPGAIAMSILILSEGPFCPWMLAHLLCWVRAGKQNAAKSQVGWAVAGGVFAGVATLVRPSWLLFTPFAVAGCLLLFSGRRRQLVIAIAMLAGLSLAMLPWWIRNYQVAERWVPTTLQVGASLYDGWRPDADGGSDMRFMSGFRTEQRAADQLAGRTQDGFEARLNDRLKDAAIGFARDEPLQAIRLAGAKFLRMWSPLPNASELQSTLFRGVIAVSYLPLLLAGLCGAWRFRQQRTCFLCLLPAVYFTGLHVIFVSSIRYRLPAMLILTVLAAAAIVSGWRGGRQDGEPALVQINS